jgi:hypothetical protein
MPGMNASEGNLSAEVTKVNNKEVTGDSHGGYRNTDADA